MFKDKTLLITGGTGSFGNAVLSRVLETDIRQITIFSRDEEKQHRMRNAFKDERIKYVIGDVRDFNSIRSALKGINLVFHAAALKQVPSCEFYPLEAFKTNVTGTENVICAAEYEGVEKIICLSTDKAVYPINAMGLSKAMMEKVAKAHAQNAHKTAAIITRYGNVMSSRGSVIPLFYEQAKSGQNLTITDPSMTRFMMTLQQAVDLVFFAFENGEAGDIFIQKAPSSTIGELADSMIRLFGDKNETQIIGHRSGEKKHETLLTKEEMIIAQDLGDYYRVPMNLKEEDYNGFISKGQRSIEKADEYNSFNTRRLEKDELEFLLNGLGYQK